jgi:hypothetical protein
MRTKQIFAWSARLALAVTTAAAFSGCATPALWKNASSADPLVPASNPRLELYESSRPADVLVVFDQRVPDLNRNTRRAYYLFANALIIEAGGKPQFVNPSKGRNLTPIPLRAPEDPLPDGLDLPGYCAVLKPESGGFLLYRDRELAGSYGLPRYGEKKRLAWKILLTPMAVALDAAAVGGAAAAVGFSGAGAGP